MFRTLSSYAVTVTRRGTHMIPNDQAHGEVQLTGKDVIAFWCWTEVVVVVVSVSSGGDQDARSPAWGATARRQLETQTSSRRRLAHRSPSAIVAV
jgi:hypothetical protein